MAWSFSFQLMPDEEILEDTTGKQQAKIKPAYSLFLTNKRAIFRFDSLGSTLTQSFSYSEILDAEPRTKLFIKYLAVKTDLKEYLLNIPDPEYWSKKIREMKEKMREIPDDKKPVKKPVSSEIKKRDLLDMLTVLRKHSLLTEEEFEEKVRVLHSLEL